MAKIAAIQMASGPHVQANLMEACRLIKEASAQGAEMVVLPETFGIMGNSPTDTVAVAEEVGKGPMQSAMSQCAKENKLWIVAGTIPIKSPNPSKYYAASIMYNEKGEQIARYDKRHLFDVELSEAKETYTESDTTVAGENLVVVDTPFGKVGMAVCYDLRFPAYFRKMMAADADIFVLPSAFTETTGKAHWEVLLRARAIENLSYMIAPAQGGYHVSGRTTYGHSMVIDYWGNVREELGKGAGIILIDTDLKAQAATRKAFPVLEHRLDG
ncbi:MAG TPA: carbon-nitrogen hydrolase family protein [Thiothrix sp.]|nr:carbon-nitrogen hydrolase family protein [Thiothrix sp.]